MSAMQTALIHQKDRDGSCPAPSIL